MIPINFVQIAEFDLLHIMAILNIFEKIFKKSFPQKP